MKSIETVLKRRLNPMGRILIITTPVAYIVLAQKAIEKISGVADNEALTWVLSIMSSLGVYAILCIVNGLAWIVRWIITGDTGYFRIMKRVFSDIDDSSDLHAPAICYFLEYVFLLLFGAKDDEEQTKEKKDTDLVNAERYVEDYLKGRAV